VIRLKIKAIILDMDGVITDTMSYHFDAWKQIFSKAGIEVTCYDIYEREGQAGLDTLREIYKKYRRNLSPQEARDILRRKERLFKKLAQPRLIRGARAFLRRCKRSKFLIALVTGTSRQEAEKILPEDIYAMFDVIVAGDEVKKGKPHPEPFLKALEALRLSSSQAVVIENAPLGIKAARRANLFCIALKTYLPESYLSQADIIISSFADLDKNVGLSLL
jgi:beta-phosphoglucomutase family hydrolase